MAVIVPAHNAGSSLALVLQSVRWQTRPPDELIVVDCGSGDDTREIARRFSDESVIPAVVANLSGAAGMSTALAEGILCSTADVLVLGDQNLLLDPNLLQRARDTFFAEGTTSVLADMHVVHGDWSPVGYTTWNDAPQAVGAEIDGVVTFRRLLVSELAARSIVIVPRALAIRALPVGARSITIATAAAWVALYASLHGTTRLLADPMGWYRVTERRLSRVPNEFDDPMFGRHPLGRIRANAARAALAELARVLSEVAYLQGGVPASRIDELRSYAAHTYSRASLPRSARRRLARILAEAATGQYAYDPSAVRAILADLVAGMRLRT